MNLSELGVLFNSLFRANVSKFKVKEPYTGLWELSMSWKSMRGYLVSEDGSVIKIPDRSSISSFKKEIVLHSHILVIRTYAGTAEDGSEHNYAVYTAKSLRSSAPAIKLVGWQSVPKGSRVLYLDPETLLVMSPEQIILAMVEHERTHACTSEESDTLVKGK